jgi:hypothetical protein
MQPAEPPADPRVDEVLDLLHTAHERLHAAQERLLWVDGLRRQGVRLGHRESMTLRVLEGTRSHEVDLWTAEVHQLVEQARALGIQP